MGINILILFKEREIFSKRIFWIKNWFGFFAFYYSKYYKIQIMKNLTIIGIVESLFFLQFLERELQQLICRLHELPNHHNYN